MSDPLEQLRSGAPEYTPGTAFAQNLLARIEAIEARTNQPPTPTQGDTMSGSSLIPYLSTTNARDAVQFYKEIFGAKVNQEEYFEMDDGRLGHATLTIGDATMYIADDFPELDVIGPSGRGGTTVAMVLQVADADETMAHAIQAGALEERPVMNQHGGRSGWFRDPWGHRWSPTSATKPDRD